MTNVPWYDIMIWWINGMIYSSEMKFEKKHCISGKFQGNTLFRSNLKYRFCYKYSFFCRYRIRFHVIVYKQFGIIIYNSIWSNFCNIFYYWKDAIHPHLLAIFVINFYPRWLDIFTIQMQDYFVTSVCKIYFWAKILFVHQCWFIVNKCSLFLYLDLKRKKKIMLLRW